MKQFFLSLLARILKKLARLTVARYKPSIVGITGNVGKTSTRDAVETVLRTERNIRSSSKNFNNELGLPLTILGDWESTEGGMLFWCGVIVTSVKNLLTRQKNFPEIIILEYGVDRPGDMSYLLEIAEPQIGIVTAVGDIPVHVEFFTGPEGVAKEKAKLVERIPATGFAILNADDEHVTAMEHQTRGHAITYGFEGNADMKITNFSSYLDPEKGDAGITFKLSYGGNTVPVKIKGMLGKTGAYASAAAAIVGLTFGINFTKIAELLGNYQGPAGRLRVIPGIKNTTIIDDTYNAAMKSMIQALDTLKSIRPKRAIAVLGDMLEIGKYTLEAHEAVGKRAAQSVDLLITVGMRGKIIAEGAARAGMQKQKIFSFDTLDETTLFLEEHMKKGDVVLVKGSQAVRMEKIVKTIMMSPSTANDLLVRQSRVWLAKPGIYE